MRMRGWLPVLLAAVACAQTREANFYTREKEAALGAQLAGEVRRQTKPLDVPGAREYVERLGRILAPGFGPDGLPYTFEVVTGARSVEPTVLPAGYVFVPAGFFSAARNEAEFAGMLAHSMAHAALRHGTRQASRSVIVNYASIPLIFLGGWSGMHASDAGMAVPLGFPKVMREQELEADRAGVEAMALAGYDPAALFSYIDRVQEDRGPAERSALPPREERLAALEQWLRELPAREYTAGTGEFERVREAVRAATALPPRTTPTLRRK